MASSPASSIFRLDWRPSRVLGIALVMLGLLAAGSVLASRMPFPLKFSTATLALAQALRLARREAGRAPCELAWAGGNAPMLAGGQVLHAPRLHLRGPLAVLTARDVHGRLQRFCWWPDTLSPGLRRQLVLAAAAGPLTGHPLARWPA
jgi:toxin CptA